MGWSGDYNWTSADTLRGNPKVIILELLAALNERRSELSLSALTIERGESNFPDVFFQPAFGAYVIDEAMTDSFFGNWADQTDSSGLFDGQSSIPHWTEAKLNTEIGVTRPVLQVGTTFSADWVWWMYKALKLLLWTDGQTSSTPHVNQDRRYSGSGHATWAAAVAAWNATSWVSWSDNGRHSGTNSAPGNYSVLRERSKLPAISAPTALYYKADLYARLHRPGFTGTYENNDYSGVGHNEFARIYSDSSTRTGAFPSGVAGVGDFNTVTVTEPTAETKGWRTLASNDTAAWRIIRKYDVTDGFEYV